MKRCPRCEQDLEISEFGICRDRKDGLNLYCRRCIREKIAIQRAAVKEYKATLKRRHIQRKPCDPARPIWRLKIADAEKVKLAFARGITDRSELRRATRLYWDDLTDIIADLNDAGEIKWNPKRQSFQLAA